jgi:ZIP family zinc transporter
MTITLVILAFATFLSTYLGGLFALRFKDKSHLIVGFSAGAVIGLAFFDLLPESLELGGEGVGSIIALGFLIYMAVDRIFGVHTHNGAHEHDDHEHEQDEEKGDDVIGHG